ncbi:MAG: hypothetical protein K2X60_06885 [Xanthobacteraceae bacterium]|nr:hypothetical protein [Xanthobacteraceae bacterium]
MESLTVVVGFSVMGLLLSCLTSMVPIDGPSVATDRLLLVLALAPVAAAIGVGLGGME